MDAKNEKKDESEYVAELPVGYLYICADNPANHGLKGHWEEKSKIWVRTE